MYTDIRHPPASSNFERRDVLRYCGLVGSHTTHIYSYIRGRALYPYTTKTYIYIQYYVYTNRIHSTMYVRIYIRGRALYPHIRRPEFIHILEYMTCRDQNNPSHTTYGVDLVSRIDQILGLFCKRPYNRDYILQKRPII